MYMYQTVCTCTYFHTHFNSSAAPSSEVEHQRDDRDHLPKVDAEGELQGDKERFADGEFGLTGDADASGGMEGNCLTHPAGDGVWNG